MENLDTLLHALLRERFDGTEHAIPQTLADKRRLLRMLMNLREPAPINENLLSIQDKELQRQNEEKGVISPSSILSSPLYPRLRLWQGDITRLTVDAIVNAANSQLLGCFLPLHNCIDNAIHSAAGMQLREECAKLMGEQEYDEPPGQAKITPGYNLPAKYVIHTVGPIVKGAKPTLHDRHLLASCYKSCLDLANNHGLTSIAFCCISTGVFRFPQKEAAQIAVDNVLTYFSQNVVSSIETVIFDVFKDSDFDIYKRLLGYG